MTLKESLTHGDLLILETSKLQQQYTEGKLTTSELCVLTIKFSMEVLERELSRIAKVVGADAL